MARILLLGPNRWPASEPRSQLRETAALHQNEGLATRRQVAAQNSDVATWVIMEDEPGDDNEASRLVDKFLRLAQSCTPVFLLWPRGAKMAGTADEIVMWQALQTLKAWAPELYVFHQEGVLEERVVQGDVVVDLVEDEPGEVRVLDPHQRSPYLLGIQGRGAYLQPWTHLVSLFHELREVLVSDLGLTPMRRPEPELLSEEEPVPKKARRKKKR